jgi:small-conductance mechanosensitive channel
MEQLSKIFILGNSLQQWLIALSIIIGGFVLARILKVVFIQKLRKRVGQTSAVWDDYLLDATDTALIPIAYILVVNMAVNTLQFSTKVERWIHNLLFIAISFIVIRMISRVFKHLIKLFLRKRGNGGESGKQAGGLMVIVSWVIWILGVIFLIDNLGYNVSTLIAGLGIGGIAIALAAQTILGDLFSYFVIFFDRPFEIGDFITLDDKSGVVEYVGIKTTRIRTLGGEQLICSNTDLTNARVHNYKRLAKRRVLFQLSVTYQTAYEKLCKIPAMVRDIILEIDSLDFDRGHFAAYGDSGLQFEFVYYVQSADYNLFMDKQQQIYLRIHEAFAAHKIEFAYPTQTLFIPEINC